MTSSLEDILERHRSGDPSAIDLLCEFAMEKLLGLCNRLLPRHGGVARWDRPSDIRQDAALRLFQSLKDVKPESERHLLNLAAMQVQRVLLDKAREHGRKGKGLGHLVDRHAQGEDNPIEVVAQRHTGPGTLERWGQFHACANSLSELMRDVFRMRWYLGLTENEMAGVLGVSRSTVQRAWKSAVDEINAKLGRRPGE